MRLDYFWWRRGLSLRTPPWSLAYHQRVGRGEWRSRPQTPSMAVHNQFTLFTVGWREFLTSQLHTVPFCHIDYVNFKYKSYPIKIQEKKMNETQNNPVIANSESTCKHPRARLFWVSGYVTAVYGVNGREHTLSVFIGWNNMAIKTHVNMLSTWRTHWILGLR